jgi:hypothetical protein
MAIHDRRVCSRPAPRVSGRNVHLVRPATTTPIARGRIVPFEWRGRPNPNRRSGSSATDRAECSASRQTIADGNGRQRDSTQIVASHPAMTSGGIGLPHQPRWHRRGTGRSGLPLRRRICGETHVFARRPEREAPGAVISMADDHSRSAACMCGLALVWRPCGVAAGVGLSMNARLVRKRRRWLVAPGRPSPHLNKHSLLCAGCSADPTRTRPQCRRSGRSAWLTPRRPSSSAGVDRCLNEGVRLALTTALPTL